MSGRAALTLAALAAGCSSPAAKGPAQPDTPVLGDDPLSRRAGLYAELQDDILTSYERDEPPDLDTGMIDPKIGTARIGAGPGDVYLAGDLARAPSRWPLDIDRATRTDVRSKHLEIELAADLTAAWMSDEVSWRIAMCGRTAVIPLRITALYAHDGDRWVPVFEHLSFGWTPTPATGAPPKPIKTEVVSGDLRDELSGVLGRGLFRVPHDASVVAQDPTSVVLGPDFGDEWQGAAVLDARMPVGRLDERRVGLVGRSPAEATIAYWVGSYVADVPARPGFGAGKTRMRVTHVFEKRPAIRYDAKTGAIRSCTKDPATRALPTDCRWQLVQSHLSQPITDDEPTQRVFGTALLSPKPLRLDCSDGTRATVPGAGPRPGARPPAAGSP